jgi:hypothetical protein
MSFAAIMGIKDDAHLNDGQKVCNTCSLNDPICGIFDDEDSDVNTRSQPGVLSIGIGLVWVCNTCCAFSSINILSLFLSIVLLVDYVYLHRCPRRKRHGSLIQSL